MLPENWKIANIVPVYKKGGKEHAENYRPISLLSTVSKVLERCVLNNIRSKLYQVITASQHGFTRGKSCVTNLLEVINHISSVLDDGGQVNAVFLDMSKAFDKVNHSISLQKLRMAGFGGSLLQWFQSYLTNRHQCVTVQGCTSTTLPVTSGVPQGSILGPVLFSLYVNDLPDAIKSSHVAMFADDTKLFKNIKSVRDSEKLQRKAPKILDSNLMKRNARQCLTRKLTPVTCNYELNYKILIQTECEQDLGVFLDKNLTWKRQVNEQSAKANKLLGYIRRSTMYIHNQEVRSALYLALVGPHLGYATQIWAPQSIELIRHLERMQRRATKYILHLPFSTTMSYSTRLQTLNLLPVCY